MSFPDDMPPGLLIAAPGSGSGKTTLTLALLRRFRQLGRPVASIKVGPDYIDPGFHAAASGRSCVNLDGWAMRDSTLLELVREAGAQSDFVLGEGVMGLFDGAPDGRGSTADLARFTGWPVVLVVDVRGMAASAAAVVHGFANFDPSISLAGVIFNRVGSARHAESLEQACEALPVPILGFLRRSQAVELPSRHLGLVQAGERQELEAFLDRAAEEIASAVDCDRLADLARSEKAAGAQPEKGGGARPGLPPLGQRIAVARDTAFAFSYSFLLEAWRSAGAEISFFSPLTDEAPDPLADALYLPGGYPELHAAKLSDNRQFLEGLRQAAGRGAVIYGECGGYMVLGEGLTDAEGTRHRMAGLLPVESSFAGGAEGVRRGRRMTLGYRQAKLMADTPLGSAGTAYRGHEFHYAQEMPPSGLSAADQPVDRLFDLADARDKRLEAAGCRVGTVMGSFVHIIDSVA